MLSGTNCFDSSSEVIALHSSCPGRGAASFTLLRRAGSQHQNGVAQTLTPDHRRTAPRCAASGARTPPLLRTRPKRVAGLHRTLLIAGHEPLLSLRGGAVGK